ncbi:hyaluronidase-1-like isoform X2 [Hyaena hyaena]|uniref:hyaluronidase-1-like isoform X2 n=1 Tax=Hyaena hyaena TaxID=95912 RepID=UPI001921AF18|nr:hyaluronidase-1-like isoform X2 [Hyaena hyaena]
MCNPWMAWLGVLWPWIKFTHSALKPVLPPVIKNQPFNMLWAAPTMQCQHFFNVDLNLPLFNIIANPAETQRGSTISIFYPNELGYYPYFSQDGKPFNGGIPQNMSLSRHLKKTADDIAKVVSWWRSEGLVVIDWERWKPQWDRNWGNRIIYKNHSLAFTRSRHPDWSEMKVKTVAQQEFESAGKSFMNTTLTLALEMRPKCLWGFYLYPDCYNYDYRINPQIYTDLVHTIGETAALGAAGIILWGGYEYSDSKEACLSVQKAIQGPLGHYAVNVTSAAKFCSQSLCNNNGRCVRKTPESSAYLHMPESSAKKYILNKSFRFIISPTDKLKTIKVMKKGFVCHCYYGWRGESCQQHPSDLLREKNKAPLTNVNFSVFLSMSFIIILLNFVTPYCNVNFSLKN